jgi:UPF0755 protein
MRNPHFMRNWLILLFVLAILALAPYLYYQHLLSPVNSSDTKLQAFVIEKGESTTEITKELEEKGLIRSSMAMKIFLKMADPGTNIQAGDFKLSPAMSVSEVIKNLQAGAVDRWVTLLEGWRVDEEAEELEKVMGIDKQVFIKTAKEGYMFPDTYLINKDATVDTVVSMLENTFDQKYDDELQAKIKKQGLTPAQGVILASIVEREARSDEVRTKVASILLKRIKIGMALNTDATIQYALGYHPSEKSWWKRNLTHDDLKVDSPYNTYLHAGLPPTPICNPSVSSLNAVANADPSTPYLYYYHDSKGNSYYAKTLDEHNENVANHP